VSDAQRLPLLAQAHPAIRARGRQSRAFQALVRREAKVGSVIPGRRFRQFPDRVPVGFWFPSQAKIRAIADGVARGLRPNTASKPSSTDCLRTR
jgi:hypothetical protein